MNKIAKITLISIFSLSIVFHLLVLIKVIPYEIVWGGRLTNLSEMYVFEAISILINTIFLIIALLRAKYVREFLPQKLVTGLLWFMFALFILNTVGNLLSNNELEKMIFTPITILLSICCLILAVNKD